MTNTKQIIKLMRQLHNFSSKIPKNKSFKEGYKWALEDLADFMEGSSVKEIKGLLKSKKVSRWWPEKRDN